MPIRLVSAFTLIALALAACGTPEPPRAAHERWADAYPNWKPGDPWPEEGPARMTDAPPEAPAAAETPAAPSRQATLPPTPAPKPVPEPPPEPPRLDELRGMNAGQITQLLGKPTLLRDEAAAQMWQYRGESCVLHLFLYPASGGERRVQHVEARARQSGARTLTSGPSECLASLVGAQRLRS